MLIDKREYTVRKCLDIRHQCAEVLEYTEEVLEYTGLVCGVKMGLCLRILFAYGRLGVIASLHLVFAAMLISRVLDSSNIPWAAVFSPMFLFDVVAVIYLILYVAGFIRDIVEADSRPSNTSCFPHQRAGPLPPIIYGLALLFKVVAEILLVLHLSDDSPPRSPPFYVSGIFFVLMLLVISVGLFVYAVKPSVKTCLD